LHICSFFSIIRTLEKESIFMINFKKEIAKIISNAIDIDASE